MNTPTTVRIPTASSISCVDRSLRTLRDTAGVILHMETLLERLQLSDYETLGVSWDTAYSGPDKPLKAQPWNMYAHSMGATLSLGRWGSDFDARDNRSAMRWLLALVRGVSRRLGSAPQECEESSASYSSRIDDIHAEWRLELDPDSHELRPREGRHAARRGWIAFTVRVEVTAPRCPVQPGTGVPVDWASRPAPPPLPEDKPARLAPECRAMLERELDSVADECEVVA